MNFLTPIAHPMQLNSLVGFAKIDEVSQFEKSGKYS